MQNQRHENQAKGQEERHAGTSQRESERGRGSRGRPNNRSPAFMFYTPCDVLSLRSTRPACTVRPPHRCCSGFLCPLQRKCGGRSQPRGCALHIRSKSVCMVNQPKCTDIPLFIWCGYFCRFGNVPCRPVPYLPVKPPVRPLSMLDHPTVLSSLLVSSGSPMSVG